MMPLYPPLLTKRRNKIQLSLRFRRNAWYDDACASQRNRTESSAGKGSHRKEPEETDYESGKGA